MCDERFTTVELIPPPETLKPGNNKEVYVLMPINAIYTIRDAIDTGFKQMIDFGEMIDSVQDLAERGKP
jgi:hypothetical protein